jgi:hypothetical protein
MAKLKTLVIVDQIAEFERREREEYRSPSILNKSFNYTPSAKTDIASTFRRFGWTEPSKKGK